MTNAPHPQRAPAEPAPSGVGAGLQPLPALKDRVRALVDSWTELQSGSWNAMAASAQYEELERISASAEQLKAMARTIPFSGLPGVFDEFIASKVRGRIVVDMTE